MSRTDRGGGSPRAVIHKRILDVAASRPDASLEGIADEVAGATVDLVERVFEEYGDPGADAPAPDPEPTETEETAMKENGDHVTEETAETDLSSLSDKQRETLRLVHDHPEWSQADVAARLDVSRATVSRRLNDIPGFEWQDRASFTSDVFEGEPGNEALDDESVDGAAGTDEPDSDASGVDDSGTGASVEGSSDAPDIGESRSDGDGVASDATGDSSGPATAENGAGVAVTGGQELLDRVDERLDRLEAQVTESDGGGPDLQTELAHKVVHAAMKSDRITEEEELRLIEALV